MRLRQILANGLSNATKFTDHGSVTLRVRQLSDSPSAVELEFAISDMGCGISPAVLPTLFQPFRQADSSTARRYGGTGLGLVITKELVGLMGGTVKLESTMGVGTTMTIRVSVEKEDVEGEAGRGVKGRPRAGTLERARAGAEGEIEGRIERLKARRKPESVKLLLAEDNELLQSLIKRTLEKMRVSRPTLTPSARRVLDTNVRLSPAPTVQRHRRRRRPSRR